MKFVPEEGHLQEGFDFAGYLDGLYGYAMVLARDVTEANLMQGTCHRVLRAIAKLRPDAM